MLPCHITVSCLITDSHVAHVAEAQLAPALVVALARKVEGVLQAARHAHLPVSELKKNVQLKKDFKALTSHGRVSLLRNNEKNKKELTTARAGRLRSPLPPSAHTLSSSF